MSLLYHNDTIIKKEKELIRALWGQFCKLELRFHILLRDLIIVILCYQIPYKPLKTLSLSQVSFPLGFPLCYIFPYEFTNSDKGKNKGKKII